MLIKAAGIRLGFYQKEVLEDGSEVMRMEPLTEDIDAFTRRRASQIWGRFQKKLFVSQNGNRPQVVYLSLKEVIRAKHLASVEKDSLPDIVKCLIGCNILNAESDNDFGGLKEYEGQLLISVKPIASLPQIGNSLICLKAVMKCLGEEPQNRPDLLDFLFLYQGTLPLGTDKAKNLVLLCK